MKCKKMSLKKISLLVSLALIMVITVGATLAYLVTHTNSIENKFTPTKVTCEVDETFNGQVKKDVSINNTGDIDAYIRATVVVTWQDSAGNVYATAPEENKDYIIEYNTSDWQRGNKDGYYYHTASVAKDENTAVLIKECKPVNGRAPKGYTLHVEIIAEAIQADGVDSEGHPAVQTAWPVTVKSGKTLSVNQ